MWSSSASRKCCYSSSQKYLHSYAAATINYSRRGFHLPPSSSSSLHLQSRPPRWWCRTSCNLPLQQQQQYRGNHNKTVPASAAPLYVLESKRLLQLVSKQQQQQQHSSAELEMNNTTATTNNNNATTTTSTAASATTTNTTTTTARDAANALLVVSTPTDTLLLDSIQKREADIISLHHAFLAITSWCLEEDENNNNNNNTCLLDCAMALTQRAHELSLAFHLPLYQRLLDAVAKKVNKNHQEHSTEEDHVVAGSSTGVHALLQLSSWMINTLTVTDASPFASSIKIMIQQRRLPEALAYLEGLQSLMKPAFVLPINIIAELIFEIRQLMRESRQDPSLVFQEVEAAEIIVILQESLVEALHENHEALHRGKTDAASDNNDQFSNLTNEQVRQFVDEIISAAMEMYDFCFPVTPESENDDSEDISDREEYDNNDNDDDDEDDDDNEDRVRAADEALKAILFPRTSDETTRATLIKLLPLQSRHASDARKSKIIILGPFKSENNLIAGDSREKVDTYDDDDASEAESWDHGNQEEEDPELDSYAGSHMHYHLPDITEQILKLTGGKELRFTSEFEDYLFCRDFENSLDDYDSDLFSEDDDDDFDEFDDSDDDDDDDDFDEFDDNHDDDDDSD